MYFRPLNTMRATNMALRLSRLLLVPALLIPLLHGSSARTQTRISFASIGVANESVSNSIYSLNNQYNPNGGLASASASASFSGVDSHNARRTMTYSGSATGFAEYGRLHTFVTAAVTNPYYNAANAVYYDANANSIDPNGTPDYLGSQGFTEFTDMLQFGGNLPAGYKARYIFHLDGVNSGSNVGAFLGVKIGADPREFYFNTNSGNVSMNWATQSHEVNGIAPDTISVQFSSQFNTNLPFTQEGVDFSGTANFAATLTLAGIELVDDNGNLASGFTVTSASGTRYNTIQGPNAVPEPGSIALLLGLLVPGAAFFKRRQGRKQPL